MHPQEGTTLRARKAPQELGDVSTSEMSLAGEQGSSCGYDEDAFKSNGCCDDTPPRSPGGSRRAQELWRKVKLQYDLVEYHVLPEYLRDNEYILRHYRSDWPLRETLLSMFTIHNETLNIWT